MNPEPTPSPPPPFDRVLDALMLCGVLLESDPRLPSVVSVIVGAPVAGSWWSHPRAADIHEVRQRLDRHEDVVRARLISGKWTYVHRQLWPSLVAVATDREPWQEEGLSAGGRALFELVEAGGTTRTDALPDSVTASIPAPGDAARELERRLLVHSREFFPPGGAHAKELQTWACWCRQRRFDPKDNPIAVADAKAMLDEVVATLNEGYHGEALLPWA